MIIVDAHEDLAWNALTFGRDYLRSVDESRQREAGGEIPRHNGETLIGWPQWVEGNVAVVFATLFASPRRAKLGPWERLCYDDPEEAHRLYAEQLRFYHEWAAANPERLRLIGGRGDLTAVLAAWQAMDSVRPVGLVPLMEGAEGIRHPEDLAWWVERGVRVLGPAWVGTRYTGGTGEPGSFSDAGRALLCEMARLGVALDLSHLSDEAVREATERFEGRLCATHANPRRLLPHARRPERHLTDETIRAVAERGGVIGVVLYNAFLLDGYTAGTPREAVPLSLVADHVDYLCQLIGTPWHVGIGSDFDGGFGLNRVPQGLNSVADLPRLGELLAARGYGDEQVAAILGGNWLRFLRELLPDSDA